MVGFSKGLHEEFQIEWRDNQPRRIPQQFCGTKEERKNPTYTNHLEATTFISAIVASRHGQNIRCEMGNMSHLYTKHGKVDTSSLGTNLINISFEKFDGELDIKFLPNGDITFVDDMIFWKYVEKPLTKIVCNDQGDEIEEGISRDYYTFRDCPSPEPLMWIQEIILKELINRMYIDVFIDCIGEDMVPSEYPRDMKGFVRRSWRMDQGNLLERMLKVPAMNSAYKFHKRTAKEQLPKRLYKVLF